MHFLEATIKYQFKMQENQLFVPIEKLISTLIRANEQTWLTEGA